jgi:hypothetical protein
MYFCIDRPLFNLTDEYLELITENAKYNESIGEWQLKGIAFTGNNVVHQQVTPVLHGFLLLLLIIMYVAFQGNLDDGIEDDEEDDDYLHLDNVYYSYK